MERASRQWQQAGHERAAARGEEGTKKVSDPSVPDHADADRRSVGDSHSSFHSLLPSLHSFSLPLIFFVSCMDRSMALHRIEHRRRRPLPAGHRRRRKSSPPRPMPRMLLMHLPPCSPRCAHAPQTTCLCRRGE